MNSPCPQLAAADAYVAGTLTGGDQDAFEEHYFSCGVCFAAVQRLQDVQQILTGNPAAPSQATPGARPASEAPPTRRPGWAMPIAASLLVAVAGAGALWELRRSAAAPLVVADARPAAAPPVKPPTAPSAPAPQPVTPQPAAPPAAMPRASDPFVALAMVVAPDYLPLTTRAAQDDNRRDFDAAMAHYSAGRYSRAAQQLRRLTARAPELAAAPFFLGISELMAGSPARARAALRESVTRGESPYADEAHFYLAKAALRDRDVATAERELRLAVTHGAGPQGEAARLLNDIRHLPNR